jgi:DNA-directed RNA polymerase specialized sigma24 family protein
MHLPLGTVKSRIYFTRRKLQQRFSDYRWQALAQAYPNFFAFAYKKHTLSDGGPRKRSSFL